MVLATVPWKSVMLVAAKSGETDNLGITVGGMHVGAPMYTQDTQG